MCWATGNSGEFPGLTQWDLQSGHESWGFFGERILGWIQHPFTWRKKRKRKKNEYNFLALAGTAHRQESPSHFSPPVQAIPSPHHRFLPGVWFYICVFLMVSLALLGQESCLSSPGKSHSESLCVLEIFGGTGKACSSAVALCLYPAQTPSASGT